MSLIALRQILCRHGRRAAAVLVVLSVGIVAAHHAGLLDVPAGDATPAGHAAMGHGAAAPDEPTGAAAELAAVCLAVLPLVLAAALALGLAVLLRRSWPALVLRRPFLRAPPRVPLRPPRAGPRFLCVVRC